MATYYKGTIFLKDDIRTLDYSLNFAYFFQNTRNIYFFDLPKADNVDFEKIRNCLKYEVTNTALQEIKNSEVIREINKLLENKNNDINFRGGFYYLDIIFEIVKGNDNNLYAKELHSGLIFPIYIPNANTTLISYNIETKRNKTLDSIYSRYFELTVNRKFNFNSLDKIGSFVKNISICDQNELNEYLNFDKKGLFGKLRKKKYLDELTRLYNKNVFKEEFKIVEDKKEKIVRKKQSSGTFLMENIEYLLMDLKTKNQDLYLLYQKKYDELLTNPNLNYQILALFEGELEASLLFKNNNACDILEYLTNLKKEYLDNILNNSKIKTDLTVEKIDKINELFLKVKDKYSLVNQREVLKNLSFLYIMEVYENKEIIILEELQNSYFADHLKTIMICIKSLQETGLIKCNYLIDLVDSLTVEFVFDIIKNIEFCTVEKEKIKEYI